MDNLFLKIGDKEIKLQKSLVKNHFKWLATLFGIDTYFEEKKKLIPYKGKTKMDKRVEAIVKVTDDFASLGVPRNQIFLQERVGEVGRDQLQVSLFPVMGQRDLQNLLD